MQSPAITDLSPETAKIVQATFEVICPENNLYYCSGCVVKGLTNAGKVSGNIALFSERKYEDNTHCGSYQELSVIAEKAGAVGVIIPYVHSNFLPLAVAPYAIPFELTISTYIIDYSSAMFIKSFVAMDPNDPEYDEVIGRLPKVRDGWGESFFPVIEGEGVLPQASICYLRGDGGGGGRVCPFAGQATFGPDSLPSFEAEIKKVQIASECGVLVDVIDSKAGEGVNCDVCHDFLDNQQGVLNGAELGGKIGFVDSRHTFCIQEWEVLIDQLASHNVLAVIVANDFGYTYTMVDASGDDTTIPVFNIQNDNGSWLSNRIDQGGIALVQIPEIKDGSVITQNTTEILKETRTTEIKMTELQILKPNSMKKEDNGIVEAGQTDFFVDRNEKVDFPSQAYLVEPANIFEFCDSSESCHYCNMLDSPLLNTASSLQNKVLFVKVEEVKCFLPVSNIAVVAEDRGAAAIVYVLENNDIITLGAAGMGTNVDSVGIPVFSVTKDVGDDILLKANSGIDVVINLPDVVNGIADETITQYIAEEYIDEDGERVRIVEEASPPSSMFNSLSASLVVLLVIVGAVGGRLVQKKRQKERALGVYNTIDSSTQFSPIIGLSQGGPSQEENNNSNYNKSGGEGGETTSTVRTVFARPWRSAFSSSSSGGGGSGTYQEVAGNANSNIEMSSISTDVQPFGQLRRPSNAVSTAGGGAGAGGAGGAGGAVVSRQDRAVEL